MKINSGDKINPDVMNDIISAWVDAEMPINPAGYEDASEGDRLRDAQAKRFEQIVNMPDAEFRALYHAMTGDELSEMTTDGSYTVL